MIILALLIIVIRLSEKEGINKIMKGKYIITIGVE